MATEHSLSTSYQDAMAQFDTETPLALSVKNNPLLRPSTQLKNQHMYLTKNYLNMLQIIALTSQTKNYHISKDFLLMRIIPL